MSNFIDFIEPLSKIIKNKINIENRVTIENTPKIQSSVILGCGKPNLEFITKILLNTPTEKIILVDHNIDENLIENELDRQLCKLKYRDDINNLKEMITVDELLDIIHYYNKDIMKFFEEYPIQDITYINAFRVFEHIHYRNIPDLLYLISTCIDINNFTGLDIIVPDFLKVIYSIHDRFGDGRLSTDKTLLEGELINLNTEIFNTPEDRHQSVWTEEIMRYYVRLENYWEIKLRTEISMNGRNWYDRYLLMPGKALLDIQSKC
ncbi:MAG: hypothetical protein ACOCQD_02260 [archaeon]